MGRIGDWIFEYGSWICRHWCLYWTLLSTEIKIDAMVVPTGALFGYDVDQTLSSCSDDFSHVASIESLCAIMKERL
jgi:hypothetical protein